MMFIGNDQVQRPSPFESSSTMYLLIIATLITRNESNEWNPKNGLCGTHPHLARGKRKKKDF